jgi:hypothetical protein
MFREFSIIHLLMSILLLLAIYYVYETTMMLGMEGMEGGFKEKLADIPEFYSF